MSTHIKVALMPDGSPEIFKSIQGEGPKIGRISTFVRTSECNLTCSWCDTPYTWRWSEQLSHEDNTVYQRDKWQGRLSVADVVQQIKQFNCPNIIFTGGEPLLQQKRIVEVIEQLAGFAKAIEFETNGTIVPTAELIECTSLFVVSPKLSNSGVAKEKAFKQAIEVFSKTGKAAYKIVVEKPEDLQEIRQFQEEYGILNEDIWVMPCGRSPQQLHRIGAMLADHVIESGYQFSPRMHVDLFGDAQGT